MTFIDKVRLIPRRYWLYYLPLIAVAVGLGVFLDDAPLPWVEGVEAREAAGKSVKSMHHGISGMWYGAWAALAVAFVLGVAGRFALRRLSSGFVRTRAGIGGRSTPAFFVFGAVALVIAAYELAPSLKHSLWGDEDYALRRSIVGQWERNAEGELWFREVTWWDTFFAYKTPNNHFLYSISARLSHGGYDAGTDPEKLHFSEVRIRMPSFIAGLGAILSLGYLVSVIGYRRAGIGAMFLLALHPWFLRHAAEARGYPLALFLAPLALVFLIKAVRRGRGVYWALFALFEALTFYAYPGMIYLLTCANLAAIAHVIWGRPETNRTDRFVLFSRWFAANTAAALPLVFLLMPIFSQLRAYMERSAAPGLISGNWLWDNLSHMATGIQWLHYEPQNPLRPMLSESLVPSMFVLCLFLAFAALGILRLIRERKLWLAAALFFPYPLTILHALKSGTIVFHWYTITSLPLFVTAVVIGVGYVVKEIKLLRESRFGGVAVAGVLLLGYNWFTHEQVTIQRGNSVEQLRESVEATRRVINPLHPEIDSELTAQFSQAARSYDPSTYFFRPQKKEPDGAERFRRLMQRADVEGKPLHVNLAMLPLAREEFPGLMEIVENGEWFERLPPFWGLQDPCTRYVYRYRPGSYKPEGP